MIFLLQTYYRLFDAISTSRNRYQVDTDVYLWHSYLQIYGLYTCLTQCGKTFLIEIMTSLKTLVMMYMTRKKIGYDVHDNKNMENLYFD